ncbi:helicase-related protein [Sagittula stellata]|uniref:helicase-related protein n=1 Tax=Sagittula stellata TaxID=52603 RepID=UPI00030EA252|nr:helicase-related protein [Sagittula stellata]
MTNLHAPGEADAPFRVLLDRLAEDLIGPAPLAGPLPDIPSEAFMTGILFPKASRREPSTTPDVGAEVGGKEDKAEIGTAARIETAARPAAAGLSFALATRDGEIPSVSVEVTGARYEDEQEPLADDDHGASRTRRVWWRRAVSTDLPISVDENDELSLSDNGSEGFDGLHLTIVQSRFEHGTPGESARLITVVVYNEGSGLTESLDRYEQNRQALFEFRMTIRADEGSRFIGRPLRSGPDTDDADERSADLLWRDTVEYAVGHTCAAAWHPRDGAVKEVSTAWLPSTRVPDTSALGHVCFESVRDRLAASVLAEGGSETLEVCEALVDSYEVWIKETGKRLRTLDLSAARAEQAKTHLEICRTAARRMRGGIATLRGDADLMMAFQLANATMARQQDWKNLRKPEEQRRTLVWRPFQLGFVLLSAASSVAPDHEDRGIMDLIWFPTGGGKTEAYLLLTAFTIFARRLKRGSEGEGVSTIMRYTLRLLTLQQFERAAAMICAANLEWAERGFDTTRTPISLGLWLGESTTPNRRGDAAKLLDGANLKDVGRPDRLIKCPACDESLDWHSAGDGVEVTCGTDGCEVGEAGPLPIYTNDDDVYDERPSLVIGTADKFAQVARNEKTAALFGAGAYDPPDLIVQDELHLISGSLGTLSGLYETAIDILATRDGHPPKVIGSTATIRSAASQVRALFARRTMQFPPPGIDAGDSAFAVVEKDPKKRGRLYVGASTIGHSKPEMLQAVCGSLLQSASVLDGSERDAAWTLLGYFNSLKELGGSVSLLQVIAPETMRRLAAYRDEPIRPVDTQIEITSRIGSEQIGETLAKLERRHDAVGAIDVALATNMISVGVDVGRLGLMVVDGQPKGVSEYIQATSRVGRDRTDGLVIGLFTAYRPRDRSRFETHATWHSALYRDVEATSVTPFAPRARSRALHAPFVAIAAHRHPELWQAPGRAEGFRLELESIIDEIVLRLGNLGEQEACEAADTREELMKFLDSWCRRDGLSTWWSDKGDASLLMSMEQAVQRRAAGRASRQPKPTPNTLRGVEATVRIDLEGK